MSLQTPNKPISASEPTTPIKKRIKFSPMQGFEFENNRNDPYKQCSRSLDFSEEEISKKRTEGFTIFSSDKNELRKNLTNKKFCKKVIKYGFCNTENCTFAHTISEFNPECIFGEACKYQGLTCNFLHPGESFVEYCKKLNIDEKNLQKSSKKRGSVSDARSPIPEQSSEQNDTRNSSPSGSPGSRKSDYLDTSSCSESDKSEFSPRSILDHEETQLPPPYVTVNRNEVEFCQNSSEKSTFTSPVFLSLNEVERLNMNSVQEFKSTTCVIPGDENLIKYLIRIIIETGYKRIDFEFTNIPEQKNSVRQIWRIPTNYHAAFYMICIAIKDKIRKVTIEFCD